jgi:nicotinamide phosphoribosyltransferase
MQRLNIILNLLLNTDSYKPSHFLQYPKGTEYISSYGESRGCKIKGWVETTAFGMQIFTKDYLVNPIEQWMIDEADEVFSAHGVPFNRQGWQHILNKHDGHLPLQIQAVPEGLTLKQSNVLFQVMNTDPQVPWLTSYIETAILRAVWFPTTVATLDLYKKRIIRKYLEMTSDSETIDTDILFKLHDFGARGVSSMESAGIGGCAHLVHFMGSDTLTGIMYARKYYNETMAAFSIPAAEHSTITVWGGAEHEWEAFENMIDQFGGVNPDGSPKLYAIVIDSYNDMEACEKLFSLRDKIIAKGGILVARPDSGLPREVVVKIICKLMDLFGYTVNSKGYKVLPDYIRVIQGDGITYKSIEEILVNMEAYRLSADNIAFGQGGGMLQQLDRDTFQFAMKASAAKVNGLWRDVYKDPVGDASKKSKRGRLALVKRDGGYVTIRESELRDLSENVLQTVYIDGKILVTTTLAEVRERAAAGL